MQSAESAEKASYSSPSETDKGDVTPPFSGIGVGIRPQSDVIRNRGLSHEI